MDNGALNHKYSSSHGIALTRSTTNINSHHHHDNDDGGGGGDDENNFTLASNHAMGRRFSSVETNGNSSSGSSDISNWSNEANGEIRTRNRTGNHRYERDFNEQPDQHHQFRHHRWTTVNSSTSVEKLPTKSYVIDKNSGLSNHHFVSTNNINDTRSTNSNGDKAKWTHKTPINGNIAV